MRVSEPEISPSPDHPDHVRLTAVVEYEGLLAGENYWFEVPGELSGDLSEYGNPWLLAVLPLAAKLGEPVRIHSPVDARLLASVEDLLRIWRSWYPDLKTPKVEAPARRELARPPSRRAAAFYSGGIDSSFTAVRERSASSLVPACEVQELITVGGFDIPLDDEDSIERLRARSARTAARLGKDPVWVRTNLRETEVQRAPWGRVAHGCALGAVGLALESRYDTLLIAATGGYRDLHPWGSHPLTDPLLSTSGTRFVHDGAAHARTEKTRVLTRHPAILDTLRVCFESRTDRNCGACPKCLRTMLCLELLGWLDRCPTFAVDQVDLGRLDQVEDLRPWDFRELRDLEGLAETVGRRDVADAIGRAVRRATTDEHRGSGRGWIEETLGAAVASVIRMAGELRPRLKSVFRG